MPSTVKNSWWLVAGTLGFSGLLILLPHFVFKREIAAVDREAWYYLVLRIAIFAVWLGFAIASILTRDDDTSAGKRAITIGIAAVYFIVTMAGAAQKRSDAEQGLTKAHIQWVKCGVKSWDI